MDATPKTMDEIERSTIEQRLAECGGNKTHAARSLGISVRTLQRKLKAWGKVSSISIYMETPTSHDPKEFAALERIGNGPVSPIMGVALPSRA